MIEKFVWFKNKKIEITEILVYYISKLWKFSQIRISEKRIYENIWYSY